MNSLADAPTDVLFGLMALHNDLIAPATAAAALRARDGNHTVSEILLAEGTLTARQRDLVETLCDDYIERHGGDAHHGLAAFVTAGSGRQRLDRVGDAELIETVESLETMVAPATGGDPAPARHRVGADDAPRYRVLRPHAKGGIGEVFIALDAELNREVALKRIQDRRADDPGSRARFLLEAEVTGGLEHPGIVPVYSLGRDAGGRPYYAMRFIRGESLKQAIADTDVGAALFRAGRRDAALVAMERGRNVLAVVAAENPQLSEYQCNLATSHNAIGDVQLSSGRLDQALAAFEQARAIRVRLVTDSPAVLQYQLDLAESLCSIGSLHDRAQRLPVALELYDQARSRLAKLAESDPSQPDVRRHLAVAHNKIAGVRSLIGPRDEARASAERARALLEPLPQPLTDELYELAHAHSLLAQLDSPGPIGTTGDDRARREAHAGRAVALLGRAIERGYRNLAELEHGPGWRPIRHRPDFQTLVRDLAFPADPFAR